MKNTKIVFALVLLSFSVPGMSAVEIPASCVTYLDPDLFVASAYRKYNPDLASGPDDDVLKLHWCNQGMKEGRQASEIFHSKQYLEINTQMGTLLKQDYKTAAYYFINSPSQGRTAGFAGVHIGNAPIFDKAHYELLMGKTFSTIHSARRDFLLNSLPKGKSAHSDFVGSEYFNTYSSYLSSCVSGTVRDYHCAANHYLNSGADLGLYGSYEKSAKDWAKSLTANVTSPAVEQLGDHKSTWVSADGRRITAIVKIPRPDPTAPVVTLPAVPAGADAYPYFVQAIGQAKSLKAQKLVIPRGVYVFKSYLKTPDPIDATHLLLEDLKDLTIEGNFSTLVLQNNAAGIRIRNAQRVKIRDLNIEYTLKLGSLGKIQLQDGEKVLVIDPKYPVTEADKVTYVTEYDSVNKTTFYPTQPRVIIPDTDLVRPVYVGNQTYKFAAFKNLKVGTTYLIKHYFYGGNVIYIRDGANLTEDISLDQVSIYSGPGMGIVTQGLKRGLAVLNSRIIPKTTEDLFSILYDGIHTVTAGGDILIKNTEIRKQGDDGTNINSVVHRVAAYSAADRKVTLNDRAYYNNDGDTIAFFNKEGVFLGTTTLRNKRVVPGNLYQFDMDNEIPALVVGGFGRNLRLSNTRIDFSNNRITNILLQSGNARVENNQFNNVRTFGVKMMANLAYFVEGTGVYNTVVRGNTFSKFGGYSTFTGVWAAITLYGQSNTGTTAYPVNGDILIEKNTIMDSATGCVSIISSRKIKVLSNQCNSTNLETVGKPGIVVQKSDVIDLSGNTRTGATSGGISVDPLSVTRLTNATPY